MPARRLADRVRIRLSAGHVCALLAVVALIRFLTWPPAVADVAFREGEWQRVSRVIDGDTVELDGGARVRLLGIDTPELGHGRGRDEPGAAAATAFTRSLLEGRQVQLTYDRERLDRYRRVLAWVFVDEQLANERIVRAGWARVLTQYRYRSGLKQRLLRAETAARRDRVGLWQ